MNLLLLEDLGAIPIFMTVFKALEAVQFIDVQLGARAIVLLHVSLEFVKHRFNSQILLLARNPILGTGWQILSHFDNVMRGTENCNRVELDESIDGNVDCFVIADECVAVRAGRCIATAKH